MKWVLGALVVLLAFDAFLLQPNQHPVSRAPGRRVAATDTTWAKLPASKPLVRTCRSYGSLSNVRLARSRR